MGEGISRKIGRLTPVSIEAVCEALRGKLPEMRDDEMSLCYRELKALCDGKERLEVMRILVGIAAVDGRLSPMERAEIRQIAEELGVSMDDVAAVASEFSDGASKAEPPSSPT